MLRFGQYLTEAPKPYAIGIVGNQGGVFGKQLDPGQYNAMHIELWPNSFSLSKHFRVSRETLTTDEWPTQDDYFSILDWCAREGYKIKFYQPTTYHRPISLKQFDPRTLDEAFRGLTFAQILTEANDQKSAIAKLHALAKDHFDSYTHGKTVDVDYFWHQPVDNPPSQAWNDLVTYREKVGGIRIVSVPVKDLIPTQPGVSVTGVERLIKVNPNRWNDNREEVVRVVKHRGRFYVMDGHHRVSAAILMGYPTVPAELQPISA